MARKAKKHHSTKSDMKQPAKPLEIQVTSCIQQLPTELLREIFSWCRNASNRLEVQGILCLVSRRFKEVAQPMQLATIALGGFSDTQRRKVSQLKALAAGSSSASRFAQTIVIDYSDDFEYDPTIVMSQLEQAMLKNLTAAIRSFERVSRVIWNFGHEYPTWMPGLVFEGLKSLPLIDLIIRFPDDSWPEFELPPLPNLRLFSIRLHSSPQRLQPPLGSSLLNFIRQCTQLSHLEVDMHLPSLAHVLPVVDTDTSPLPLKHLSLKNVLVTSDNLNSSLAHLRELVSFCLYSAGCEHRLIKAAPDGSLAGRNPWTVFSDAGIHLNNILTDTPWDASLLADLEKTPGLNSLTICSSGYGSIFLDDPSFHKTLQLLVPRVPSCLVELSIVPQLLRRSDWPHRPDWCCPFNESIVLILSQLKHLRRLNLTLDMAKLVLGTLCHGAEPQMEESLKPILLMCDKLPALEELSLQLYNSYSWILENPEASVHQVFESFASGGSLLDTSQYLVLMFVDSTNKAYRQANFDMINGEEGDPKTDRPLIVQFCANDPDQLLASALAVQDHCDAVDLNLGCPQEIARKGRYGSFLQDDWELIYKLINTLHVNLSIPVTAKFRVFSTIEKTVEYAKMLERAGAQILTCHGRLREQRGQNCGLADWAKIRAVKEAVSVPVFANGNILYQEDIQRCLEETGCDGVMSAEGQLYNPALFAGLGRSLEPGVYETDEEILRRQPRHADLALEYLEIVKELKTATSVSAIKGHLFKIMRPALGRETDLRETLGKVRVHPKRVKEDIEAYVTVCKEMKARMERDEKAADGTPIKDLTTIDPVTGIKVMPHWLAQPYFRPLPEQKKAYAALTMHEGTSAQKRPLDEPRQDNDEAKRVRLNGTSIGCEMVGQALIVPPSFVATPSAAEVSI
ncbi:hypothetical protein NLJ89_g10852 [Agrocybe chaxingu]|uniref:tRNA-dihydrouridine(16/17) synthase [NAD(P)(+)] n=1 Tax=Agrocybe chaxingu TaxID=84603 RepID=A0A9W8JN11_9AGAR|nr:hypothetical protein NLJ89_g10852 [Agrocybe chaxingu]